MSELSNHMDVTNLTIELGGTQGELEVLDILHQKLFKTSVFFTKLLENYEFNEELRKSISCENVGSFRKLEID